jgi:formate hydrogenlyase transcriptional activator
MKSHIKAFLIPAFGRLAMGDVDSMYRKNKNRFHEEARVVGHLAEEGVVIPLLVCHFFRQFAQRMDKPIETIPSDTIQALSRHTWPGNIRELQNLVERAVILSPGPVLQVPLEGLTTRANPAQNSGNHETLKQAERAHILSILKQTRWVVSGPNGAATRLGINRSTLKFRMKKLGIALPWAAECQL